MKVVFAPIDKKSWVKIAKVAILGAATNTILYIVSHHTNNPGIYLYEALIYVSAGIAIVSLWRANKCQ